MIQPSYYLHLLNHEIASRKKLMTWLHSVPDEARKDTRFKQAVVIAGHLAACRENWLDRILTGGQDQKTWWPKSQKLETLESRHEAIEERWIQFLESLSPETLSADFEYKHGSTQWRWNVEGQTIQLVGHAAYHRGQIALLVDQLGGKTTDSDYLFWRFPQDKKWGEIAS